MFFVLHRFQSVLSMPWKTFIGGNYCTFDWIFHKFRYHKGEESFGDLHEKVKRGDIVGVNGYPARSKTGELSIIPFEVRTPVCLKLIFAFCTMPCFPLHLEKWESYYGFVYSLSIVSSVVWGRAFEKRRLWNMKTNSSTSSAKKLVLYFSFDAQSCASLTAW